MRLLSVSPYLIEQTRNLNRLPVIDCHGARVTANREFRKTFSAALLSSYDPFQRLYAESHI